MLCLRLPGCLGVSDSFFRYFGQYSPKSAFKSGLRAAVQQMAKVFELPSEMKSRKVRFGTVIVVTLYPVAPPATFTDLRAIAAGEDWGIAIDVPPVATSPSAAQVGCEIPPLIKTPSADEMIHP